LILSRQGGDYSRGIVLRVHRFGTLSDQRGTRQSGCSVSESLFYVKLNNGRA